MASPASLINWGKFENEVYKLGEVKNWRRLVEILKPITEGDFAVTSVISQALVERVCSFLDTSVDGEHRDVVMTFVDQKETGIEGAEEAFKALLASGVNPDKADISGNYPSHLSVIRGQVDLAALLFLCRPNPLAMGKDNLPLFGMASMDHESDVQYPAQKAMRPMVVQLLFNNGYLHGFFPSLAFLAARKQWFAVKNLLRRHMVQGWEFWGRCEQKTAVEWAEAFNQLSMADEIRYYAQPAVARLTIASQKLLLLTEEHEKEKAKVEEVEAKNDALEAENMELKTVIQELTSKVADKDRRLQKILDVFAATLSLTAENRSEK